MNVEKVRKANTVSPTRAFQEYLTISPTPEDVEHRLCDIPKKYQAINNQLVMIAAKRIELDAKIAERRERLYLEHRKESEKQGGSRKSGMSEAVIEAMINRDAYVAARTKERQQLSFQEMTFKSRLESLRMAHSSCKVLYEGMTADRRLSNTLR